MGKGTKAGLYYKKEFERICKVKYGEYYILKCDISKFFASIDKEILKKKVARKIKYKRFLYEHDCIQLANLVNSMRCYESLQRRNS